MRGTAPVIHSRIRRRNRDADDFLRQAFGSRPIILPRKPSLPTIQHVLYLPPAVYDALRNFAVSDEVELRNYSFALDDYILYLEVTRSLLN